MKTTYLLILVSIFSTFLNAQEKTKEEKLKEDIEETKYKLIRYYNTCNSIAFEIYSTDGNEKTTKAKITLDEENKMMLFELGEKFYNKAANEYLELQNLTDFKLKKEVREKFNQLNEIYSQLFDLSKLDDLDGRKVLTINYIWSLRLGMFAKEFLNDDFELIE